MAAEAARAGTHVGPYELLAPIGAGGMGEVWKARDTRLDRAVAIKFSQAQFTERFEREARAIAALSHPNICTLHDVGPHYLVMEYVEGEPLSGPLPLSKAVEYAGQILEALQAAHRKAIIHRDLKPANILITRSGVKLLDFGLAKHASPLAESDATLTSALTGEGHIVGTLQYMAPEQLQGKDADARSDIFSFGCVLYEMLTGKRAFEGSNAASVIAAVLEREPAPLQVPPPIERIVRTCLAKDPESRFQNSLDVKRALLWAVEEHKPAETSDRRRLLWAAAAIITIAVTGAAVWKLKPTEQNRPVRKFEIAVPNLMLGFGRRPVLSPDGERLAYSSGDLLWVRNLGDFEARSLPGTEGARLYAWSPDGQWIAFIQNTRLMKIAVAGGPPVRISDAPSQVGGGADLVWLSADRIVYSQALNHKGIEEIIVSTGVWKTLVPLVDQENDLHFPTPIPNSDVIAFLSNRAKAGVIMESAPYVDTIWAYSKGRRSKVAQFNGDFLGGLTWSDGHLLFLRQGGSLWALPFSPSRAEASGEAFLVTESAAYPAASGAGSLAIVRGVEYGASRMLWADRWGKVQEQIGDRQEQMRSPALSPDGTRVAYMTYGTAPNYGDVWLQDLRLNTRTRLTFTKDSERTLRWIPGQNRLAIDYVSDRDHINRMAVMAVDGHEPRRELGDGVSPVFSADGRYLIYGFQRGPSKDTLDIAWKRVDGSGEAKPFFAEPSDRYGHVLSPDGKLLAYTSNETGSLQLFLTRFPEGLGKWQVSERGARRAQWNRAGTRLYFTTLRNEMMEAEITRTPEVAVGKPRLLFNGTQAGILLNWGFDVAPDGNRFLVLGSASDHPPTIGIIENWSRAFSSRMTQAVTK